MFQRRITHALSGDAASKDVHNRCAAGRALSGGVVLTEREIVYTLKYRRVYLPYDSIVWAYRQVQESRLSFGRGGVLQEHRVVMVCRDGARSAAVFQREEYAAAALAKISECNPSVAVGYTAENRERFAALTEHRE